jgi:hypothetical protein
MRDAEAASTVVLLVASQLFAHPPWHRRCSSSTERGGGSFDVEWKGAGGAGAGGAATPLLPARSTRVTRRRG